MEFSSESYVLCFLFFIQVFGEQRCRVSVVVDNVIFLSNGDIKVRTQWHCNATEKFSVFS